MILSGHDSVLGSCQIFPVFGRFLPRLKYFRTDPSRSKPNHDFSRTASAPNRTHPRFKKIILFAKNPVNPVNKRQLLSYLLSPCKNILPFFRVFRGLCSLCDLLLNGSTVRVQRSCSTGYGTGSTFRIARFYRGPYGCTG